MKSEPAIFFYDGTCGVCDASVDFLLRHSPGDQLHFSQLQSAFAQDLLARNGVDEIDLTTAYLFDGEKIHCKSGAILKALSLCDGPVKWFSILRLVPKPVRDFCYDMFSRHRHRIWKRQAGCRLLNESERMRFREE